MVTCLLLVILIENCYPRVHTESIFNLSYIQISPENRLELFTDEDWI